MVKWQEAFRSRSKQGQQANASAFPPPRQEAAVEAGAHIKTTAPQTQYPDYNQPIYQAPAYAPPPFGQQHDPGPRQPSYPGRLKRLHNHLDDIYVNILLETKEKPDSLLICGATRGEGCMFVSFHLALFLSLGHRLRTLYIDLEINTKKGNPYIPAQTEGLASFFLGYRPLNSLVAPTEYDNFYVLSSGYQAIQDTSQNIIIRPDQLQEILTFSKQNFDIAVFNGQPITLRPVMLEVAQQVDAVLLVCRYGRSRREVTRLAIERLRDSNAPLLGLILNEREFPVPQWAYRILK